MAVRQVKIGVWESSLTGQCFDSEIAAKHYDNLERKRTEADSEGAKILDSLSAPQLKSLFREINVQSEQGDAVRSWQAVQEQFLAENPEFLPCERNGAALAAVLIDRGKLTSSGVFQGTMQDVIDAYYDLAERGVLQLRKGMRLPARANETSLYDMPMEDLLNRARGL